MGPDISFNGNSDVYVVKLDCFPRNVTLGVTPAGLNTLQVSVTRGGIGFLRQISFQIANSNNAQVSVNGGAFQAPPLIFTPNPPVVTQVFQVRRAVASGWGTLSFLVTDDCGPFQTMVGGGPSAWPGGGSVAESGAVQSPRAPSVSTVGSNPPAAPVPATPSGPRVPGAACAEFPTHAAAQAFLRADPTDPRSSIAVAMASPARERTERGSWNPPLDHVPVPRP